MLITGFKVCHHVYANNSQFHLQLSKLRFYYYGHFIIGSNIWLGKANIMTSAVLISQGLQLLSNICHTHVGEEYTSW